MPRFSIAHSQLPLAHIDDVVEEAYEIWQENEFVTCTSPANGIKRIRHMTAADAIQIALMKRMDMEELIEGGSKFGIEPANLWPLAETRLLNKIGSGYTSTMAKRRDSAHEVSRLKYATA